MVDQLVRPALEHLASRLKASPAVRDAMKEKAVKRPLMILAIDECMLLEQYNKSITVDVFRRCMQLIGNRLHSVEITLWLLLLDTSSAVGGVISPGYGGGSARAKQLASIPPFLPIGFDTHADTHRPVSRPRDALLLDALKRYGRPLWNDYDVEDLLEMAIRKLRCGDPAKPARALSDVITAEEVRAIAALSHRICLDIVPLRSDGNCWAISKDSVNKHMRYITHFLGDKMIATRAPSEPVLALAAWLLLAAPEATHGAAWTYKTILSIIESRLMFRSSINLKGVHGEFLARLLLVMAHDACDALVKARATHATRPTGPAELTAIPAVNLSSFLESLLGPACGQTALPQLRPIVDTSHVPRPWTSPQDGPARGQAQSGLAPDAMDEDRDSAESSPSPRPGASERGALPDLGSDVWLNFTHMAVLEDKVEVFWPHFLWDCWKRGLALQCGPGQDGVDGILPVYLGSLDDALDYEDQAASRMSYIAWQAKNRTEPCHSRVCLHGPGIASLPRMQQHLRQQQQQQHSGETAGSDPDIKDVGILAPLFTILFDLGTTVSFSDSPCAPISKQVKVVSETCTSSGPAHDGHYPSLRIRGCDGDVLPFLKRFDCADIVASMAQQQRWGRLDLPRDHGPLFPGENVRETADARLPLGQLTAAARSLSEGHQHTQAERDNIASRVLRRGRWAAVALALEGDGGAS
ncbi:uncharacterized protein PFL1_04930 [Pseudozyma flocculosa PF-1]|uniref:Uncharacterized protein n=1 Tax=Pseudozyma flocculosa PF-1 TaxID=1277687 RepID=A0A061H9X6_9BASI|nr:uncharacterized protein PFL1_04930 [Pseudozyma flocculosa PF-1]EPQ27391.1 hypothetical protein PFL1_04930 [Pseudozyma flocculosa PF-1]